jgi:hypothetical protein
MLNMNEAVQKIKSVGSTNARIISSPDGKAQIEVREGGAWNPLVSGITRKIAEDIMSQATNRVILG